MMVLLWLGGFVHALVANRAWLRDRQRLASVDGRR
jgi:hypothetical protein